MCFGVADGGLNEALVQQRYCNTSAAGGPFFRFMAQIITTLVTGDEKKKQGGGVMVKARKQTKKKAYDKIKIQPIHEMQQENTRGSPRQHKEQVLLHS